MSLLFSSDHDPKGEDCYDVGTMTGLFGEPVLYCKKMMMSQLKAVTSHLKAMMNFRHHQMMSSEMIAIQEHYKVARGFPRIKFTFHKIKRCR